MKLWFLLAFSITLMRAQSVSDPPPDRELQQGMILRVQQNALQSQSRLPDFICTQRTTRSEDKTGKGDHWKQRDTMEVEFSFVDRRPHWRLMKINGKATRKQYDELDRGFVSDALLQFFSLPGGLFGEKSGTIFQWERWDRIGAKRVAVFSIRVPASVSKLELSNAWSHRIIGFHGLMYVDPDAAEILRLEVSLEPPRDIGVQASDVSVDYGFVPIGAEEFLLPVRAVVRLLDFAGLARNEIDVVQYQKYGADSRITFGDQ